MVISAVPLRFATLLRIPYDGFFFLLAFSPFLLIYPEFVCGCRVFLCAFAPELRVCAEIELGLSTFCM